MFQFQSKWLVGPLSRKELSTNKRTLTCNVEEAKSGESITNDHQLKERKAEFEKREPSKTSQS